MKHTRRPKTISQKRSAERKHFKRMMAARAESGNLIHRAIARSRRERNVSILSASIDTRW